MHKIDSDTATAENEFTAGDPGPPEVPPTEVTEDWLNAVQNELVNIILAAGLTLNKENNSQLLAAVSVLLAAGDSVLQDNINAVNAKIGTFVNDGDGNPVTSQVNYDVDANVTENAWESFGPTGSGKNNIWTALDSVPSDADWVEIKLRASAESGSDTVGAKRIIQFFARKNGSSEGTNNMTEVATQGCLTDTAGNGAIHMAQTFKVGISSRCFDINWASSFNGSPTVIFNLVGWDYNQ